MYFRVIVVIPHAPVRSLGINCSGLLFLFVVSVSMVSCFGVDIMNVGDRLNIRYARPESSDEANADMSPSARFGLIG